MKSLVTTTAVLLITGATISSAQAQTQTQTQTQTQAQAQQVQTQAPKLRPLTQRQTLAQARAQSQYYPQGYMAGDLLLWELDLDQGDTLDDFGLRVRGGAQLHEYFAVEGHLGAGGADSPAELTYLVGAYAKGILPVAREFRLYGLVGLAEVDFDLTSESDFSYGFGGEFDLTRNLALGADYMRYIDTADYSFDATSVGLRYRF